MDGDDLSEEDAMVVSFDQVKEKDPTINEIITIPKDYMATRSNLTEKWQIQKMQ